MTAARKTKPENGCSHSAGLELAATMKKVLAEIVHLSADDFWKRRDLESLSSANSVVRLSEPACFPGPSEPLSLTGEKGLALK